jgi:hypothetical protein
MSNHHQKPGTPAPALIYPTALTCGILAAIAVAIHLGRAGFDLTSLWEGPFTTKTMQLRTAGPWWAMAGAAFVVSGITAAALSRLPLPWRRFRLLRWIAGAALVFVLADIGQAATELPAGNPGTNAIAAFGALLMAGVMALCGAYFTARH